MSRRALVVEDSVSMRQMIGDTLEQAGFQVTQAEDGVAALECLQDSSPPDLVLTDLNMPRMDGITLVREIRRQEAMKFTPVLLLTTESQLEKKQEAQRAGATGWIVKPFHPKKLLQVIDRVLPAVPG